MQQNPILPLAVRLRQAAQIIGVCERTLWTWTQAGLIPHKRVGTGKRQIILYAIADLQAWLSARAADNTEGK